MNAEHPRFGLARFAEPGFVEVSPTEFESIRRARDAAFEILGLEERLDLVVENYAEFEQELFSLALRHSLRFVLDWSSAMSELQSLNRRLANLLTTARLYVHQTERSLTRLFGRRSPQFNAFRAVVGEQVHNSLGYRVMDAFRNYIQHSNFPIHRLMYDSGWKDEKEGRFLVFATVPQIQVSRLHDDRALESIAEELRALGDLIDVRPLVRQHVQSLMTVHLRVRDLVAAEEANSLSVVEGALTRGGEAFHGDAAGLVLVEQDGRGGVIRRFDIFREPIERLRYLRGKNPCLANLPLHYVSGKASPGERSG